MKNLLCENIRNLVTGSQIHYRYWSLDLVQQFLSYNNKTTSWYQLSGLLERLYYYCPSSVTNSLSLGLFQGTSSTFVEVKERSTFEVIGCVGKPAARLLPCC